MPALSGAPSLRPFSRAIYLFEWPGVPLSRLRFVFGLRPILDRLGSRLVLVCIWSFDVISQTKSVGIRAIGQFTTHPESIYKKAI